MNTGVNILRGTGLYIVFIIIYIIVQAIAFWLVYIINHLFETAGESQLIFGSSVMGGYLGVVLAVSVLNDRFRPYPARGIAAAFMIITMLLVGGEIAGYLLNGIKFDWVLGREIVTGIVSCLTVWIVLWLRRGDLGRLGS